MKLAITALLCLSLLLNTNFSLAKKTTGLSDKLNIFKKTPKIKPNVDTKSKTKQQFNQGSYPQQTGGHVSNPNSGGYPRQPGYPAGGYPAGGYPAQGSPYGGGYGGQGGHGGYGGQGGYGGYGGQGGYGSYGGQGGRGSYGGYGGQGGYGGFGGQGGYGGFGGYGGYPGGYINHNPNNKIPSPHYGGSFGYGGYGAGHGSPFSHSVQAMGVYPQDKSRGFGRTAVLAAAGGAMAGMALGYGLGRFPRPQFHFHSPQEEYYYNHYMYRKYGIKSTDSNDYSRDYKYSPLPVTYDSYMDSCMKRNDILPAAKQKPKNKPATTSTTITTTATTTPTSTPTPTITLAPSTDTGSNTTTANSSAAEHPTSAPSAPRSVNQSEADPVPPLSQAIRNSAADDDDDDDTVSIVEIGYPALIEQLKVKRCLQLYMVYSEKYLKKKSEPNVSDRVQRLELGLQGSLAVLTSSLMMLLNSNMLTLLH